MQRISFKQLEKIKEFWGSDDFEVGHGGEVKDGRGDYKFAETHLTLRFGYWSQINTDELEKRLDRWGQSFKVELDAVVFDDDCGSLYSYKIS